MLTVVADTSALDLAARAELLDLLPLRFGRILLAPTIVDELIEIDAIDALMAGHIEQMIEVVDLTQDELELVASFQEAVAAASQERALAPHRGEAEALALMRRGELEAELFICEDEGALAVAGKHGIPAQRFAEIATALQGSKVMGQLAVAAVHEPAEQGRLPAVPTAPVEQPVEASPAPAPAPPGLTLELDAESTELVEAMVAAGIGSDALDVVRRAIRGLASATMGR